MRHSRSLLTLSLLLAACAGERAAERGPSAPADAPVSPQPAGHITVVGVPADAMDDTQFVAAAASGGAFEVASSRTVLAGEPEPRTAAFARRMIRDHERANQELQAIAQREGIALADRMLPQHEQMLSQLEEVSAGELSGLYASLQERAHVEAIDLFERCARSCRRPAVRDFAARTLPVLRLHLQHAREHLLTASR